MCLVQRYEVERHTRACVPEELRHGLDKDALTLWCVLCVTERTIRIELLKLLSLQRRQWWIYDVSC